MSGETIQPPDGINYEVISTREETRPAIQCGFNDIGAGNPGVFSIETRLYREWANGTLVRTWQEEAENFLRCAD